MTAVEQRIAKLHDAYCRLSGMKLERGYGRDCDWLHLIAMVERRNDVTPERALELVIASIKAGIRTGRRNQCALRFKNIISRTDEFEEELSFAMSMARKPAMSQGHAEALRATGRPAEPPTRPARHINQVMNAKGFKELVDFGLQLEEEIKRDKLKCPDHPDQPTC